MKASGRQARRKEKLENLMNEFVSRRGWCSTSTGTRDDAASFLLRSSPSPVSFSKLPLYILPYLVLLLVKFLVVLFIDLVVLLLDHLADSNLSTPSYSSYTLLFHPDLDPPPLCLSVCSSLMTSDEIQNIWALRNSTSSRELDAVLIN